MARLERKVKEKSEFGGPSRSWNCTALWLKNHSGTGSAHNAENHHGYSEVFPANTKCRKKRHKPLPTPWYSQQPPLSRSEPLRSRFGQRDPIALSYWSRKEWPNKLPQRSGQNKSKLLSTPVSKYVLFLGVSCRPSTQKEGIYLEKPYFPQNTLEQVGIWSRGYHYSGSEPTGCFVAPFLPALPARSVAGSVTCPGMQ